MTEEFVFTSVKNSQSLVHRVVNELQRLIIDGELKIGVRLPAQTELAERFGVSRTVVREAVGILVTKGLLESKHGIGTMVSQINQNQVVEELDILLKTQGITTQDLYQVRSIIEVEIAGLAAGAAKEEDILKLQDIVKRMTTTAMNSIEYVRVDDEFHCTLAKMSGNPLLVVLSDSIRDLMQEIRLAVSRHPNLTAITTPDHARILECVLAKDIMGARKAMMTHLDNARRIQEGVLSEKELEPKEK